MSYKLNSRAGYKSSKELSDGFFYSLTPSTIERKNFQEIFEFAIEFYTLDAVGQNTNGDILRNANQI